MREYKSDQPMWDWFGLTYSSYLVLPRALLCGMPIEWQERMVKLLGEMSAAYDYRQIKDDYIVQLRNEKGRFVKDPFANYRYPPALPYKASVTE